jgi:hypothetical protein
VIEDRILNRAGFYRENENGEREFLVFPRVFRDEVCSGSAALVPVVAAEMHRRDFLIKGEGKNWARKERVLDGNPEGSRGYCIRGRILGDEYDAAPKPTAPCRLCGHRQFWISSDPSGGYLCAKCTPPPPENSDSFGRWWYVS